jgi:Na+/melibiose symporter-like transporter
MGGLIGVFSGSGALLALFVFLRLPTLWENAVVGLRYTYILVAAIAFGFSVFLYLALRPRIRNIELPISSSTSSSSSESDEEDTIEAPKTRGFMSNLKDGLLAIKNPRILLGYMAGLFFLLLKSRLPC